MSRGLTLDERVALTIVMQQQVPTHATWEDILASVGTLYSFAAVEAEISDDEALAILKTILVRRREVRRQRQAAGLTLAKGGVA